MNGDEMFADWTSTIDPEVLASYSLAALLEFSVTLAQIWALPVTNPKRSFDWQ
jgi:hypothetical protein